MAKNDDQHVTFVIPDKSTNTGSGQFGEESYKPTTPKPAEPPPAQRISSQPAPKEKEG